MALSKKHVNDVCCSGDGANQCRYLDEDYDDKGKWICLCKKLSPDQKIIDEEVDNFLADMKTQGQDPDLQGVPLGDNCSGFIVLKTKPQGYDVKP